MDTIYTNSYLPLIRKVARFSLLAPEGRDPLACRVRGGAASLLTLETTRPGTWTGKDERMRGSYCDKRSVVVQLEVAGMDTRQAEAVANAIRYSKDPAVTRAELRAALCWAAVGIIAFNIVVTVVLIRFL